MLILVLFLGLNNSLINEFEVLVLVGIVLVLVLVLVSWIEDKLTYPTIDINIELQRLAIICRKRV